MSQKTAIVTGGNRGIGYSITEALVEAGYFVIVGARHDTGLKKKFGDAVRFIEADVRDEQAHKRLVQSSLDMNGSVDVYVNNAGFSEWRPIEDIDKAFIEDLLGTNLIGAFWGCKWACHAMKAGGSIVNISSLAGKRGSANNSAYCASKFGMNGLTQSLSKEVGPRGIRVNSVCPVLVQTQGLLKALSDERSPAKGDPISFISNFAATNSALLRLPTGREVASVCVFLASDAADAITGQCINVDCGVFPQ